MQNRNSPLWRDLLLGMSAVAAAALMLRFSGAFAEGVREGMLLSIATLISSLFPFMVLCTFLTRTPAIDALSRPLAASLHQAVPPATGGGWAVFAVTRGKIPRRCPNAARAV